MHVRRHVGASATQRLDRRLWWSAGLNAGITAVEVVGAALAGSLALWADALHNLGDVAALGLALVARRIGRQAASLKYTYGLKRVEVFAALLNAAALLVITLVIGREALQRLMTPAPVRSDLMLVVALVALAGNAASVLLLRGAGSADLNVKTAMLHLMQDALASLAVLLAALFAQTRVGPYLDPVASLVICFVVLHSALSILGETFGLLAEGAPAGLDVERLAADVATRFSPARLHHLHVWEVGPGQRALTAHLAVEDMRVSEVENLCAAVRERLREAWGVAHATLEPEVRGCGGHSLLASGDEPGACWPPHDSTPST